MGEHNNEGDLADTEDKKEIDSERGEDKAILDDEVEGEQDCKPWFKSEQIKLNIVIIMVNNQNCILQNLKWKK